MDRLAYLLKKRARHGDVFTLRPVNGIATVVVSEPELIKQVFTAPAGVLDAGACNRPALGWLLGEHSVLLLDGEKHLAHRRLMLPAMHGDQIAERIGAMETLTRTHLEQWPTGEYVEVLPLLRALTLEIVVDSIFGSSEKAAGRALCDLLPTSLLMATTGDVAERSARDAVEEAKELLGEEVARRRGRPDGQAGNGILSELVAARYEDGSQPSDEEVRDEALGLIAAGTGTTANSLAWTLERLARNRAALERVAAEADSAGPYTGAVVTETLRMRPAVPVLARLVRQPLQMGAHLIPTGTLLAPCPLLVHHRPDIYPEPMSFKPERFLERKPGTYTWMPFGGGVRRCIGNNFAMVEMRVVLAELLPHLTPHAIDSEPEGMSHRGNSMIPAGGAHMAFDSAGA